MFERHLLATAEARLSEFDSVAILGPRQVGKTTLARQMAAARGSAAIYLDLENPTHLRQLDDPVRYFNAHQDKLLVLDEIQRSPEIFSVLRGQIDERRRSGAKGKFLLLGSASMALLRQSAETLAGRISFLEMQPLQPSELPEQLLEQERLWLQGGFPQSFSRTNQKASLQWRYDFIRTYIERDIPQFGLQVDSAQLHLFWRMLANDQGELFNAQRYAKSLGISGHTVARYLEILEKLFLVRKLPPWYANMGKRLVKSPRPYVRDTGVLHALLGIASQEELRAHPVVGKSWEGFVIEALIQQAGAQASPYFYRTAAGAEADLVIEFSSNRRWVFEVKHSSAPKMERGFHHACADLSPERKILIHRGEDTFPMREGVEAMPLLAALRALTD